MLLRLRVFLGVFVLVATLSACERAASDVPGELGTSALSAHPSSTIPTATLLVKGLEGGRGSTVGPDGALYVPEGDAGTISRVDPQTGNVTTFASGLPKSIAPFGGPVDVAFIRDTAYVLVTLVSPEAGGHDVVGIYRVEDADSFTVIADIGEFSRQNPPNTDFFMPPGVQYALEVFQGGFLVTDGHLNRVLKVTRDGQISELIAFDNVVPTGLETRGNTVYMTQAGPVPHLPETGRVLSFEAGSQTATELASGIPLAVDVEFGRGQTLYVLSQGEFTADGAEGTPALPGTGALMEVNADGTLTVIADSLNQPTSVDFIRNTAYVTTLGGEVWEIEGVASPSDL